MTAKAPDTPSLIFSIQTDNNKMTYSLGWSKTLWDSLNKDNTNIRIQDRKNSLKG